MSEPTKACSITKNEIEELIMHHGRFLAENTQERIERISYLHKRLKSFNEVEMIKEEVFPASLKKDSW